ncbi:MarR family winged helix-turn-helix transcriptional regulator [Nonomuraea sp. NPDC048826]|uniref:MarR family winged helix-turn-helix transcriptional regulator n=1 Tax=Nonomuraea sp. NPDC048826 TaxID=3364347 RepID=UPI00371B9CD0
MERPIGYWLKRVDRLIEAAADHVFADAGLGRRHWQVLNTLYEAPRTPSDLAEALRPFWAAGEITQEEVIGELARRGWAVQDGAGRHTLTADGMAGHAAIQEKINGIRSATVDGLADDDYHRTVAVLRRMAENLEAVMR